MANYNNNETYKLLEINDPSESDIDFPEIITPRKKKQRRKLTKKARNESIAHNNYQSECSCNIRIVTVWVATILLITWIITLTWLAIVLHSEIERLDSAVRQVVASSQGVPDALQKCHTISKNLQNNQTQISLQINELKLRLENFTKEIADMQIGLNKIKEKLHNAPEYVNVPQEIKEVSNSIANLGSHIKDITSTVAALQHSKEELESTSNILVQNVTDLKISVINLQNSTHVPLVSTIKNHTEIDSILNVINDIKNNITLMNSTLSNHIGWIRGDLKKNNINIENISNLGQNMSARVSTLEGLCGETTSTQISTNSNLKNLSDKFEVLSTTVQNQETEISELHTKIYQLSLNNSELSTSINKLGFWIDKNNTYVQTVQEPLYKETNLNTDNPSSTTMQETVPTQSTANVTAKNNSAAKPSILTS